MANSIGPFHIYSTGKRTVLGFGGRDLPRDAILTDYTGQISGLISRCQCSVFALDMTGVTEVSNQFLELVIYLTRMPNLSVQLMNLAPAGIKSIEQAGLSESVELVALDVPPVRQMRHFTVHERDGVEVIHPSAAAIRDALIVRQLEADLISLGQDVPNKIIDLSGVTNLGSSALAVCVSFASRIKKAGGQVVYCNLSDGIQECFNLTGIGKLLNVASDEDSALAVLQSGRKK